MSDESNTIENSLVKDEAIKRLINRKRDCWVYESVKKARLTEFVDEGWEPIRTTKTKVRLRKTKPHDLAFEDRVWALFARMGFTLMNRDRSFKISCSKDPDIPPKQIDVFAADTETAIILECKSSEEHKRGTFQKDIAEIASIKGPVYATIRNYLNYKPKFAWIFATSNVFPSKPDEARLKEAKVTHFNQDDISYYEGLVDHLGPVARYQLLGRLFKGLSIPELDCKVPAVKGSAGGHTYYSFSVQPELLLKISFVLHRTDSTKKAFESYQRMVNKARIRDIEKYINNKGFFPNAVIINVNSKRPMQFDLAKSTEHPSISELGILHLPNQYHSSFIIDGQHRLYGYANTEWKSKNTIPVVAFENMLEEIQTKIFVDINNKQKAVSKNLLMTLMGEFNWNSENDDEAIAAIKTRLIDLLNNENESPLYKRIKIFDEKGSVKRCLTKNYLIGQALNKTKFFGEIKKRKLFKPGFFSREENELTLRVAFDVLSLCLGFLSQETQPQWEKGGDLGGFIAMNLGISASIRVIDDILSFLESNKKVKISEMVPQDVAEKVIPFLKPLASFVNGLDGEQIKKLRGHVGGSAVDIILREFQSSINEEFPDFSPEGLEKWKREHTGMYNAPARTIGDEMQLMIRKHVFEKLKDEYGSKDKRWWAEGVPKEIQIACSKQRIEEGSGQDEDYTLLLHYERIIRTNKEQLLNEFTPPEMGSASVEKRLNWFGKWNSIRNKYSHPERGKVTEEEFAFVTELSKWLVPRLRPVL